MSNSLKTHALWQLTRGLLELGIDIGHGGIVSSQGSYILPMYSFQALRRYSRYLTIYRTAWYYFCSHIFSKYSMYRPGDSASQINTHTQDILNFLCWIMEQGIEMSSPDIFEYGFGDRKPWSGFRTILNALQLNEDLRIGMFSLSLQVATTKRRIEASLQN